MQHFESRFYLVVARVIEIEPGLEAEVSCNGRGFFFVGAGDVDGASARRAVKVGVAVFTVCGVSWFMSQSGSVSLVPPVEHGLLFDRVTESACDFGLEPCKVKPKVQFSDAPRKPIVKAHAPSEIIARFLNPLRPRRGESLECHTWGIYPFSRFFCLNF